MDLLKQVVLAPKLATDSATKAHDFIRQTLDTTNDPALKNALTQCKNAYRVITESFASAAVSFFQKDYDSVQEDEHATTPSAEASCEKTLHAWPNNLNLLDNRNRQMKILIAMAVTSVMELLGIKA